MGRLLRFGLLVALAGTVGCRNAEEAPASARPVAVEERPRAAPPADPPLARPSRQARQPDPGMVATARELMGPGVVNGHCGPYLLVTDVAVPRHLETCRRLAAELDGVYEARFGLVPVGRPREAILFFARAAAFRAFVREETGLPPGYGGFSSDARGLVALYVGERPDGAIASTLAHELAHLVQRRTLGPGLRPWLAEGLASALGDTASASGFGPLVGIVGAEGPARRLMMAYDEGLARKLVDLVELRRRQFDTGLRSFDYEQSALFVRYLLTPPRADRFRGVLAALGAGEPYRADLLPESLGMPWPEIETDFEGWLRSFERPANLRPPATPRAGAVAAPPS